MSAQELISQVLWWMGLFAFLTAFGYVVVSAFFNWLIDVIWPPTADEISRREAEKAAKQATKQFKARQRLRAVRFWNF